MRILWDASNHTMYPIAGEGLTSGTVQMVRNIAAGLADRGHTVHVIAPDLEQEEQWGPNLWYWPASYHPTKADVAIQLMHVNPEPGYDADMLVLATFGCDPFLGPEHEWAAQVDAFPVFCAKHAELLQKLRPTIKPEQCHYTGLGIDLAEYRQATDEVKIPGRIMYANDPARGLFYVLDIFDKLRQRVPDATLHVGYDFDRGLKSRAWEHSQMAQLLWECKRRIEQTPGVANLGAVSRKRIVYEQASCQVHVMPSDPPNVGTQIWGMTQMECAAAGAALVLSDVEAFPEVFGEGATILPVVGRFHPAIERRIDAADYAEVVAELMTDGDKWKAESKRARELAAKNTWSEVARRWDEMLGALKGANVG